MRKLCNAGRVLALGKFGNAKLAKLPKGKLVLTD